MQITLNGKITETADNCLMSALIKQLDLEGKRIAVEVNEELVPRSTFASHILKENDHIEIVHAIGGG